MFSAMQSKHGPPNTIPYIIHHTLLNDLLRHQCILSVFFCFSAPITLSLRLKNMASILMYGSQLFTDSLIQTTSRRTADTQQSLEGTNTKRHLQILAHCIRKKLYEIDGESQTWRYHKVFISWYKYACNTRTYIPNILYGVSWKISMGRLAIHGISGN